MITWFIPYKNIIPDDYVSSIFDIDYNKLYSNGKRLILTDLDNTLISYKATEPTDELYKWKSELEGMGFEIIIVSNSGKSVLSISQICLELNMLTYQLSL